MTVSQNGANVGCDDAVPAMVCNELRGDALGREVPFGPATIKITPETVLHTNEHFAAFPAEGTPWAEFPVRRPEGAWSDAHARSCLYCLSWYWWAMDVRPDVLNSVLAIPVAA